MNKLVALCLFVCIIALFVGESIGAEWVCDYMGNCELLVII